MEQQVALLGGGCFWCIEAVFLDVRGVTKVLPGYAGGHVAHPTYQQVCTGATGHAEVVEVTFDPREISYEDILRIFFTIHDPTTRDRQGNDVGSQYRSVIFAQDEAQRGAAARVIAEIEREAIWPGRIVTQIAPAATFHVAEPEHHDYFNRNPWSGYCRAVVGPKVAKFRKTFADRLRRPAAA